MIGEIQYYMDACGRFFFLPNHSCLVTLIYFVSYLENREIILKANPYFFTWQNTDSVPNYAIVLVSELM